jgi:hypothetical protein
MKIEDPSHPVVSHLSLDDEKPLSRIGRPAPLSLPPHGRKTRSGSKPLAPHTCPIMAGYVLARRACGRVVLIVQGPAIGNGPRYT